MIRSFLKYFIVFALLVLSGWNLMSVSHKVQKLERDIALYDSKIAKEHEKIRVLKSEWAYLNNPERLEAIASLIIGLDKTKSNAVISNIDNITGNVFYNEVGGDFTSGSELSSSVPVSYIHMEKEGGQQ